MAAPGSPKDLFRLIGGAGARACAGEQRKPHRRNGMSPAHLPPLAAARPQRSTSIAQSNYGHHGP
jgi:hypothetical protein